MIDIEKLLGRKEIQISKEDATHFINDKIILIFGAGGSIGSELCRQLLQYNPKQLILFGRNENNLFFLEKELKEKFNFNNVIVRTGSITDEDRVNTVLNELQPQIVYHAAANKHVPLCESNVSETIFNNVYGTKVVVDAAISHNVKSFVFISTDKAVNPKSIMGSTKRICELYIKYVSNFFTTLDINFAIVRFGNVLGSSGSVVPIFEKQIKEGGPIKITDIGMTRFFMSIPEACRLVIQSSIFDKKFGSYILDMGEQVKIVDLAKNMIEQLSPNKEIDIIFTGIRPGEKITEELTYDPKKLTKTTHNQIFTNNDINCSEETFDKINDLFYFNKNAPENFLRQKIFNIVNFSNNPTTHQVINKKTLTLKELTK